MRGRHKGFLLVLCALCCVALVTSVVMIVSTDRGALANPEDPPITGFIGTGTSADPFQISNRAELDFLAQITNSPNAATTHFVTAHYVLTANIDMGGFANMWGAPIGNSTLAPFRGHFDGQGFEIRNLASNRTDNVNDFGLFGVTNNATIRNLVLRDISFFHSSSLVATAIGGLIGRTEGTLVIDNVRVNGVISVVNGSRVGGLIGEVAHHATIRHSIRGVSAAVEVTGGEVVGGLIGRMAGATLTESFSTGSVTANSANAWVGGLIGAMETGVAATANIVRNTYATGSVLTTSPAMGATLSAGGLVGRIATVASTIENSFASGSITVTSLTGTRHAGGLVGAIAIASAPIRNSAAVGASINMAGGTRVMQRLATRVGTVAAVQTNNAVNSDMGNSADFVIPFPAITGDVFVPAHSLDRLQFNQRTIWEDSLGWDFSFVWTISPMENGGLPTLRTFANIVTGFVGNGTAQSPFLISSVQDLEAFRDMVNAGNSMAGRHFRLMANLDLSNQVWSPIGSTVALQFSGTFDGNNHTIFGLRTQGTVRYTGLFGVVGNAGVVRNLTIHEPDIVGIQSTGTVTGAVATHGRLENIFVNGGTVLAQDIRVGGVVGDMATSAMLVNVHSTANVYGRGNVGGLVGSSAIGFIHNSSFVGNVQTIESASNAAHRSAGGLIGLVEQVVTISNSFTAGYVSDTWNISNSQAAAGGFVGRSTHAVTILNSYTTANVTAIHRVGSGTASDAFAAGFIGLQTGGTSIIRNSFVASLIVTADTLVPRGTEGQHPVSAAIFMNGLATTAHVFDNTQFSNGITLIANNPLAVGHVGFNEGLATSHDTFTNPAHFVGEAELGQLSWDMGALWTITPGVNNGFPHLRSALPPTSSFFTGDGTVARPFEIRTTADLINFADRVNSGNNFHGQHVRLMADVDLGGVAWMPIGNNVPIANVFSGHFNGNNHTIRGLHVERAVAHAGLFGRVIDATIENLTVENPNFVELAGNYTGVIAGSALRSTFRNVHVEGGNVRSAGTNTGSIVGHADGVSHFENVSSSAEVFGRTITGGLVGRITSAVAYGSTMSRSHFAGIIRSNVTASAEIGGLIGIAQGVVIDQSYSSGSILNTHNVAAADVGGLVGLIQTNASTITNSFHSGRIHTSAPRIGGIVGRVNNAPVNIRNVFHSGHIISTGVSGAHVGGIIGNNTVAGTTLNSTVSAGDFITHFTITSRAWFANTSSAANNIAPATSENNFWLETNYSTAATMLANTMHEGDGTASRTLAQLNTWATYQNIGWNNSIWQISANVNGGFPTLRNNTFRQVVPVGAREDNPIVISNAGDLADFRNAVNAGNQHTGMFIRVVNGLADIELQDDNWIPIGNTAANHFAGFFDFNGATVRGMSISSIAAGIGLFGHVNTGSVRNLNLYEPTIARTAGNQVGGVVGVATRTTLDNVHVVRGRIENTGMQTGGVVGQALMESHFNNISSSSFIWGTNDRLGGLVGDWATARDNSSSLINSHFAGVLRGGLAGTTTRAGGLVGLAQGLVIDQSYNSGNLITLCNIFGGLVGETVTNAVTITNSFNSAPEMIQIDNGVVMQAFGGIVGRTTITTTIRNVFNSTDMRLNIDRNAGTGVTTTMGGIVGLVSHAAVTINGAMSAGDFQTMALLNSSAWFAQGASLANSAGINTEINSNNNIFLDTLSVPVATRRALTWLLHEGAGTSSRTLAELNNIATFTNPATLNWDSNIWEIIPGTNNNFPVLRNNSFRVSDAPGGHFDGRPIEIENVTDLIAMRATYNVALTRADSIGLHYVVTAPLDLSGYLAADGTGWNPIGATAALSFTGRIDFRSHAVTGLEINRAVVAQGLFGHAHDATIMNLNVINPRINRTAQAQTAAVIGHANRVSLYNVRVTNGRIDSTGNDTGSIVGLADGINHFDRISSSAEVFANHHGGGLIGRITTAINNTSTLTRSHFNGVLRSATDVATVHHGGLIGTAQGIAIDQSYNGGLINSRASRVGGLIGQLAINAVTITNSFNAGEITVVGSTTGVMVGGLVGQSSFDLYIRNSFNNADITIVSGTTIDVGGIVGQMAATNQRMNGVVTAGNIHAPLAAFFAWFGSGSAAANRPVPALNENNVFMATMQSTATTQRAAANLYHTDLVGISSRTHAELTNNSLATYTNIGWSDDVWQQANDVNRGFPTLSGLPPFAGSLVPGASADAPVEINSLADFLNFRTDVNNGTNFLGMHLRVNVPLDLTTQAPWTPIGDATTRMFMGSIDFQNNPVTGLVVENGVAGQGLFGFLTSAHIQNLRLYEPRIGQTNGAGADTAAVAGMATTTSFTNVHVVDGIIRSTGANTGSIVGRTVGITNFDNVSSTASVYGAHRTGGLAGWMDGGFANASTMHRSYFAGVLRNTTALAASSQGGLIGEAQGIVITQSYNTGAIHTRANRVGGLVGQLTAPASRIENSFNGTDISVLTTTEAEAAVGGLVGSVGAAGTAILNSYNVGDLRVLNHRVNVPALTRIGGIIGFVQTTDVTLNGAMSAGDIVSREGIASNAWFANGANATTQRIVPNPDLSNNNLHRADMTRTVQTTANGYHASMGGDGIFARDLEQLQQLSTFTTLPSGGAGWSNSIWQAGNAASGNFPTLVGMPFVHPRTNPTLVGYTRENPFIINTTAEFINFRNQVNSGTSFCGMFLQVSDSLAEAGIVLPALVHWVPIGNAVTNPFRGHFDFNGATIHNLLIDRMIAVKGLFGHTNEATIKNLTLENPIMRRAPGNDAGLVVGLGHRLHLENIHVNGGFIASEGARTGSIVGHAIGINNFINLSSSAEVWGRDNTGGLIGLLSTQTGDNLSRMTDSFFSGSIQHAFIAATNTYFNTGGLIGQAQGIVVERSYNSGNITGRLACAGGIIGRVSGAFTSTVRDSFNVGNLTFEHSRTASARLNSYGGIVGIADVGARLDVFNVMNTGTLRANSLDSRMRVGGIIGLNRTISDMQGAVSVGNIYSLQTIASSAWFANQTSNYTPVAANNVFVDTIMRTMPNMDAPSLHIGLGTSSRTIDQLRNIETFVGTGIDGTGIGWSNDVWEIRPMQGGGYYNNGFPVLRGLPFEHNIMLGSSPEHPLVITTTEEFLNFRAQVNAGNRFVGQHISVEIPATGIDFPNGVIDLPANVNWVPIGNTATNFFGGSIDFNGVTIRNLRNISATANLGLFGFLRMGATILNLYIEDPIFHTSLSTVGSLASDISGSTIIENVHVTGEEGRVEGANDVGGLIGRITAAVALRVDNVSSMANVTGRTRVGGLIGEAAAQALATAPSTSITNAFTTGRVQKTTTSAAGVGGLIGRLAGISLDRTYASGDVVGMNSTGGLVGYVQTIATTITNSFAVGDVTIGGRVNSGSVGGLIGRNDAALRLENVFASGSVFNGNQRSSGTSAIGHTGGLIGLANIASASTQIINSAAMNPMIDMRGVGPTQVGHISSSTSTANVPGGTGVAPNMNLQGTTRRADVFMGAGNANPAVARNLTLSEHIRTMEQYRDITTYQIGGKNWSISTYDEDYDTYNPNSVWIINPDVNDGVPTLRGLEFIVVAGPGTAGDPLIITNYDELIAFRMRVNAGDRHFGRHVKLAADIDLAGRPQWIPIGTSGSPFEGTFNGGGHTISNFNATVSTTVFGFFGFSQGGTIHNLNFYNVNVNTTSTSGTSELGIVVGRSVRRTTIDQVTVYRANVHSNGGIVGGLIGRTLVADNVIRNSQVTGATISGTANVGGFVGDATSTQISNSAFDGTVIARNNNGNAGGIIGRVLVGTDLSRTTVTDVSVRGLIMNQPASGNANPVSGGVVGRNDSPDIRIENVLMEAEIIARNPANRVNEVIRAGGLVGMATLDVHVNNNVIVSAGLHANRGPASLTNQRAHHIGVSSNATQRFFGSGNVALDGTITPWTGPNVAVGAVRGDGGVYTLIETDILHFDNNDVYTGWAIGDNQTWSRRSGSFNRNLPFLNSLTFIPQMLNNSIVLGGQYTATAVVTEYQTALMNVLQTALSEATDFRTNMPAITINEETMLPIDTRSHQIQRHIIEIADAIRNLRAYYWYDGTSGDPEHNLVGALQNVAESYYPYRSVFLNWAQLQAAIVHAENVLAATEQWPDGTNAVRNQQVREAIARLQMAKDALIVDLATLHMLIAEALAKNPVVWDIPVYWPVLMDALAVGQGVVERHPDVTGKEVFDAIDGLRTALTDIRAAILNYVIGNVQAFMVEHNHNIGPEGELHWYFTEMSWANLVFALGVAANTVENLTDPDRIGPPPSTAQILATVFQLELALNNLRPNKQRLQNLYDYAREIDLVWFHPDTNAILLARIADARVVLDNPSATWQEVRVAYDTLRAAINAMMPYVQWLRQLIQDTFAMRASPEYPSMPEDWRNELTAALDQGQRVYARFPIISEDTLGLPYIPAGLPTTPPPSLDEIREATLRLALALGNVDALRVLLEIRIAEANAVLAQSPHIYTHMRQDLSLSIIPIARAYAALPEPSIAGLLQHIANVEDARMGLRIDMSVLYNLIATAQMRAGQAYTAETLATLNAAIASAQTVHTMYEVHTYENIPFIHNTIVALQTALSLLRADMSDLWEAIEYARTINGAFFDPLNFANMLNVLQDAERMFFHEPGDPLPTVLAVYNQTNALWAAIEALEIDLAQLEWRLEAAEEMLALGRLVLDPTNHYFFTDATRNALLSTINRGHAALLAKNYICDCDLTGGDICEITELLRSLGLIGSTDGFDAFEFSVALLVQLIIDLDMAMSALTPDPTRLNTLINNILAYPAVMDFYGFTQASVNALMARAQLARTRVTELQLTTANQFLVEYQELQNYMSLLGVDRTELLQIIELAESVRQNFVAALRPIDNPEFEYPNIVPYVWLELQVQIIYARGVANDPMLALTPMERVERINEVVGDLERILAHLLRDRTPLLELHAANLIGTHRIQAHYMAESWEVFAAAMAEANRVLSIELNVYTVLTPDAYTRVFRIFELQSAYDELQMSIMGLIVDMSELEYWLERASMVDGAYFNTESYATLADAIEHGQHVFTTPNYPNQIQRVADAVTRLQTAYNALIINKYELIELIELAHVRIAETPGLFTEASVLALEQEVERAQDFVDSNAGNTDANRILLQTRIYALYAAIEGLTFTDGALDYLLERALGHLEYNYTVNTFQALVNAIEFANYARDTVYRHAATLLLFHAIEDLICVRELRHALRIFNVYVEGDFTPSQWVTRTQFNDIAQTLLMIGQPAQITAHAEALRYFVNTLLGSEDFTTQSWAAYWDALQYAMNNAAVPAETAAIREALDELVNVVALRNAHVFYLARIQYHYTAASWQVLAEAVYGFTTRMNNGTQEQVDDMTAAILYAIQNLVRQDKYDLAALIVIAEARVAPPEQYSTDSVAILLGYLQTAREVYADVDSSRDLVLATIENLQNALDGLIRFLFDDWDELVDAAFIALRDGEWTEVTYNELRYWFDQAVAINPAAPGAIAQMEYIKPNLQQAMQDLVCVINLNAIIALIEAVYEFMPIAISEIWDEIFDRMYESVQLLYNGERAEIDEMVGRLTGKLRTAIFDYAFSYDPIMYTAFSWGRFSDEIERLVLLFDANNLNAARVEQIMLYIETAITWLVPMEYWVDLDELKKYIDDLGLDEADFTAETWQRLVDALAEAEHQLRVNTLHTRQSLVDAYYELRAALDGLAPAVTDSQKIVICPNSRAHELYELHGIFNFVDIYGGDLDREEYPDTPAFLTGIAPGEYLWQLLEQFVNDIDLLQVWILNRATGLLEKVYDLNEMVRTGMIIRLVDSDGNTIDEITLVVMGDVDGSGAISVAGRGLISNHINGVGLLEGAYLLAADVTGAGIANVSVADVGVISNYLGGVDIFAGRRLSDDISTNYGGVAA